MPIRVGFLTEGHDYLILHAYLAKLLEVAEDEILAESKEGSDHGRDFVLANIDETLTRYYGMCMQLVIVSMDNDGNLDMRATGDSEDPNRPRHWRHEGVLRPEACGWCFIHQQVERTRQALTWIPAKPANTWPIVIAVAVETIEAWLLTTQAIVEHGKGSLHAEQQPRKGMKHRLYGKPAASRKDVERIALPLVRKLDQEGLGRFQAHSRSFLAFADQVGVHKDEILTAPACW